MNLLPCFSPGLLTKGPQGPCDIAYVGNTIDTSNSSTYTLNGVGIGTPGAHQTVIVGAQATRAGSNIVQGALSANGQTGILLTSNSGSNNHIIDFFSFPFLRGATADFVFTIPESFERLLLSVWIASNLQNPATPVAQEMLNTGSNGTGNHSVAALAGGIALGLGSQNTGPRTMTWTTISRQYNDNIESNVTALSGGLAATPSTPFTATITSNSTGQIMSRVITLR